jgi:hypothetical protein
LVGLKPRTRIVLIAIGLAIVAVDLLTQGLTLISFLAFFFFLLPGFFGGLGSRGDL